MYHCHLLPITVGYDHILPGTRSYLSPFLTRQFGPNWEEDWRDSLQNSEVLLLETPAHILAGCLVFSVSSDVLFIHIAFLHDEFRGSVLIVRALRALDALAGARGCRVVRCFVDASNQHSLQICLACGFEPLEADSLGVYLQAEAPIVRGKAANRFTPLPILDPVWRRDDFDLQRFAGGNNLCCQSCIYYRPDYCELHHKQMDRKNEACSHYQGSRSV